MSKENPTPAEKRRKTSLSKADTNTLIGIILRKDASEKEYKTRLVNCHDTISELNKKVDELEHQIIVLAKKNNEQACCNASVNKTHKSIIESLKLKYKRSYGDVIYYKKLLYCSLIVNVLFTISFLISIFS